MLARVEITSEDQLAEIRDYVKPLEARRMGKLMKASLLASLKALRMAGVERPDAIITGTTLGCWENSEALLRQMEEEGEGLLKPTLFMQSTHNTISSNIAIRTRCHGYNVTYCGDDFGGGIKVEGGGSMDWLLRDAELQLRSGRCKTVLVGWHDEITPLYRSLIGRLQAIAPSSLLVPPSSLHSVALVLACSE